MMAAKIARPRHDLTGPRHTNGRWPRRAFLFARGMTLIPVLSLLLIGLMLTVSLPTDERNRIALQSLEKEAFEPLDRARSLKDRITVLHTRLFELLSMGGGESDKVIQRASADALMGMIDDETANLNRFVDDTGAVPPPLAAKLRQSFADYTSRLREIARFAADDTRYGALLAGPADDYFGHLRASLDSVVQALSQHREAVVTGAANNSVMAERTLLGLGLGTGLLALLGPIAVGRSMRRPVVRLAAIMHRLAHGETDLAIPGTRRGDEVGAMAKAVAVYRANLMARLHGDVYPRRGVWPDRVPNGRKRTVFGRDSSGCPQAVPVAGGRPAVEADPHWPGCENPL